ncbi:hypothetical protein SHKM778_39080 [Streptomyces sp. KM77-8]|uniref:PAS domain-containing protein n=1 Tax=Streptomyces haneummycinicus TaxID=3074435 RepID=A0AAT9HJT7_9ACTN
MLDTDLRYVSVNPALERINGTPAEEHLGRTVRELLPLVDAELFEAAAHRVLATGTPFVDRSTTGRTPADPDEEHVWSVSLYRLENSLGTTLGVAVSVEDITERYRANAEAETARRRLAVIADATARIGTTLDLERTAGELVDVAVPELADEAAVDLLDAVVQGRRSTLGPAESAVMRALAVRGPASGEVLAAADPPGEVTRYAPDRLITECVRTGLPVMVPRATDEDLARIARSPEAAALLARAGVHSYLAVPLIARGEVLGALDLTRTRNPRPFDADDLLLARELASRAAVQIDNARWYQNVRDTALTLQRSLLPSHPPVTRGLEVASRYQPASATCEIGGDWFDVIPLEDGRTALVVGDVMGSGVVAAAAMGRLRTATQTLASSPSIRPSCWNTWTGSPPAWTRRSPPVCTSSTIPVSGGARSPTPGICRRSGCVPATRPSCSSCPPGCRWGWAGSASPPPRSSWRRVTGWCSTPTVSSRREGIPWTSVWSGCWPCWSSPATPWRRSATCCCAPCASRTTPTTWPCSSPARHRAERPYDGAVPITTWACPRRRRPAGCADRRR